MALAVVVHVVVVDVGPLQVVVLRAGGVSADEDEGDDQGELHCPEMTAVCCQSTPAAQLSPLVSIPATGRGESWPTRPRKKKIFQFTTSFLNKLIFTPANC